MWWFHTLGSLANCMHTDTETIIFGEWVKLLFLICKCIVYFVCKHHMICKHCVQETIHLPLRWILLHPSSGEQLCSSSVVQCFQWDEWEFLRWWDDTPSFMRTKEKDKNDAILLDAILWVIHLKPFPWLWSFFSHGQKCVMVEGWWLFFFCCDWCHCTATVQHSGVFTHVFRKSTPLSSQAKKPARRIVVWWAGGLWTLRPQGHQEKNHLSLLLSEAPLKWAFWHYLHPRCQKHGDFFMSIAWTFSIFHRLSVFRMTEIVWIHESKSWHAGFQFRGSQKNSKCEMHYFACAGIQPQQQLGANRLNSALGAVQTANDTRNLNEFWRQVITRQETLSL